MITGFAIMAKILTCRIMAMLCNTEDVFFSILIIHVYKGACFAVHPVISMDENDGVFFIHD